MRLPFWLRSNDGWDDDDYTLREVAECIWSNVWDRRPGRQQRQEARLAAARVPVTWLVRDDEETGEIVRVFGIKPNGDPDIKRKTLDGRWVP
jgi:hypothetical protein